MYVYSYGCKYVLCIYVVTYVCLYVVTYVYMYVCIYYVCTYVCIMYVCSYVCMYVCVSDASISKTKASSQCSCNYI
jgi:hypothetical protein